MKNLITGLIIGWVSLGAIFYFFPDFARKDSKIINEDMDFQSTDIQDNQSQKLLLTNSITEEEAKQYVCNYLSKRNRLSNKVSENTYFYKMGFDELNALISYWDDSTITNDSLKLYLMIYPDSLNQDRPHSKANMLNLIMVRTVGLYDQINEKDGKQSFFTFGSIQNQVGQCPPPPNCFVDTTTLLGQTLYEMDQYPGLRLPLSIPRRRPNNQ